VNDSSPNDAIATALAALGNTAAARPDNDDARTADIVDTNTITPRFVATLRTRVERALTPQTVAPQHVHDRNDVMPQVITPYLCVHDAAAAIRWYADSFHAQASNVMEWNNSIGHAELDVAGARFYLADEAPSLGVLSPRTKGPGVTQSIVIDVAVVDDVITRAVDNGATLERPIEDSHGRRNGWIMDPFGHRWNIGTPTFTAEQRAARRAPSEVHCMTLSTPDVARGAEFYSDVLGWRFSPPNENGSRHVTNTKMPIGLRPTEMKFGTTEPGHVDMWFTVRDFDDALDRVGVAGGTVVAVTSYDSGREALCEDDQGAFKLIEPAPGYDR
jgi:uncharacterized glyoxalase superfamily protein PhnB/catechol 2,3-dioxygenase-like lactoylglutathione lyase family enzyme